MKIWSPGKLPPGITVDKLRSEHESIPPNPLIAKPFFLIGYIENWGTGTNRIIKECVEDGQPEPEFRETGTSFVITFRKDVLSEEYLEQLGLNERQKIIVDYIKKNGRITTRKCAELLGISTDTALREISTLLSLDLIDGKGVGRGTYYVMK